MSTKESIFVSIACLDDPDIVLTVADIFARAQHPERVFVGVCLQIDPNDPSYQDLGNFENVRIDTIHFEEAKGPIYARYRCEQLLEDEDYYLQIDCHSRFFEAWDEILIEEFKKCQQLSNQVAISHYPVNISNMDKPESLATIGQVNRFRQIDEAAIKSHGALVRLPKTPLSSLGISAAMLFITGETKKKIPFDPNLHFGLHAAEQVLYAIRLWTHGYDIFTPTRHALATQYEGSRDRIPSDVKAALGNNRKDWPQKTWSKVKYLLGLDTVEQLAAEYRQEFELNDFRYGLGSARTLLDYYRFSGIHGTLKDVYPNYSFRHEADS